MYKNEFEPLVGSESPKVETREKLKWDALIKQKITDDATELLDTKAMGNLY